MLNRLSLNIFFLIVVSFLIVIFQNGEINRDGVLYLTQAQFIVDGNWDKAMSVYNWPFFSILIASLHSLTGLTLQYSGHLINIILFITACFFYFKNVSLVSRNKNSIFFATLILLTSITLMDDYLSMVLRDHGLWAGMMIGVFGYLRWIKDSNWRWSFVYQAGFFFGTFFRPECLVFNIFLPFTHQLFFVKTDRLKSFIQSISISLIGLIILLVLVYIFNFKINSHELTRLNEFIILPLIFLKKFAQPLDIHSQDYFIKILIDDYSLAFKYLFFSYISVFKWVTGLGLLHLFLFSYALKQGLIDSLFIRALTIFFIITVFITIFHFFTSYVLVNRYWMINFWIVYIIASIGLNNLWTVIGELKHPRRVLMKTFLVVIMISYFLNILIDKPSKNFEKDAGEWVKSNQLNANEIYFNQNRIAYYAGFLGYEIVDFSEAVEVLKYQYLIIRHDNNFIINDIPNYLPIEYFPSEEKPKVIIYKRINND